MKYIRHKAMRDVCCEVMEDKATVLGAYHVLRVIWINLLGTMDHPKPFIMGSSKRLATEEIMIRKDIFKAEWENHVNLSSVKISAKSAQR